MTTFLRLPVVIERTGLSRSTIYTLVDTGSFPKPVKLSERAIAWPDHEISAWCEARCADR